MYLGFLIFFFISISFSQSQPLCEDFLMQDVCEAYDRWGWCHLHEAQLSCRLTCRTCGPGWTSWSGYSQCSSTCNGQKLRSRQCRSRPIDCPGNDMETQQCNTACIPAAGSEAGVGAGGTASVGPTGITKAELTCNSTHFLCQDQPPRVCVKLEGVCDGFSDCSDSSDEEPAHCFVSANSESAFEIRNEKYQVCMEVITDDPEGPINGVRAYRRCPSALNPIRQRFLWHWWGSFHLMNVYTGRCLVAQNPTSSTYPKLSSAECDVAQINQKFVCDDFGTGFLFVKLRDAYEGFNNRYLSLGPMDSGWPVILEVNDTNYNKLWQRGPKEPPETICGHFQVYWGDWGPWSPCTSTCKGGERSHVRICINGEEGVPPCTGGKRELGPCNSKIECEPKSIGTPNSRCSVPPWRELNNTFRLLTKTQLDPACFQVFADPPMTYDRAKESCRKNGGFLATMKEEAAQILLTQLVNSGTPTTERIYLGIEENLFKPPVQGHHLRYVMDDTPVGDFQPWKTDCVVGPGYSYSGEAHISSSGVACQGWDMDGIPHDVEVLPVGETDHNHCRNPNFDPKGPWCYTIRGDIERDYCDIPQCTEVITSSDPIISADSVFYLAHSCDFHPKPSYVEHYQLLDTAFTTTQYRDCGEIPAWETADDSLKYAWDTSRTRIINIKQMKCLEASSSDPDAEVSLQTCDSNKVTQRWRTDGNRILAAYSDFHSDLQIDAAANARKAVVTASEYSSWTASRSGGHLVDFAVMRDLPADDSFVLFNVEQQRCLGVELSGPAAATTTAAPELKFRVALKMQECRYSGGMRWSWYLSTRKLFFNLYTSLCMSAVEFVDGAEVLLLPCSTFARNSQWRCHDDFRISSRDQADLYLTSVGDKAILAALEETTSRWRVWRTQAKKVCDIQIPRGDVAVGTKFALRNGYNGHCLQTDNTGNVFSRECVDLSSGSREDEVWRFTESPTMLMHYATRRCLAVRSVGPGVPVFSVLCDVKDNKQHWSMILRPTRLGDSSNTVPHYSLHLVMDVRYMLTIHGTTRRVLLRESLKSEWIAINKFSFPANVRTQADCVISNATYNYYRGNVTTTRSGKTCSMWPPSTQANFAEAEENYCRNPGDFGRKPWCFIQEQGRWFEEECLIPVCPIVKVAMNKKGEWELVDGKERLSYICQAEPECYRGIGDDYQGTITLTPLGRCVLWTHHVAGTEKLRNYCRNPDSSSGGPWCYVDAAASTRATCAVKKCHKTCDSIPEGLPHAETIFHSFSATTWGVEIGSVGVTQCYPGFWISKDNGRNEMECQDEVWRPEPAPCITVTCDPITIKIPGADLTTSSKLYGQRSIFTCKSGTLAGPGKPTIRYRCNDFGKWEAEENQLDSCTPTCEDGWLPFRAWCYQVQDDKVNFDEAKEGCEEKESLMADIDDKHEFEFLKNLLLTQGEAEPGIGTLYWVGIRHHQKTPKPLDPQWRDFRSENALNKFDVAEKKGANYLPFLEVDFFIMSYLHNRFIKDFDDILAYNQRCMFVDAKKLFVATRGCNDYPRRKMAWKWVSPFHLYNIASGRCLTGFPVNGYAKTDMRGPVFVDTCDVTNRNQYVGCRRHGGQASLKLLFNENSYFVDTVEDPWDRVQMGGGYYAGNQSRWVLNTSDYDICHHSITFTGNAFLLWEGPVARGDSYTYAEAQAKCRELSAELASFTQVAEKVESDDISSCACAWTDGNAAYSVTGYKDPLCRISAPNGGVKVCANRGRADAWCFKGEPRSLIDIPWAIAIWLDSETREGVAERDSSTSAKYICKREMRWHCPEPPDLYRASRKEGMHTVYSYLGTTAYECDPGYWFNRGIFVQELICTSDLEWEPRPETLFCITVDCPPPPDIAFASKTVNGLLFLDTTTYRCELGYWFGKNRFTMDVVCSGYADWHPPVGSVKCVPIKCDPPDQIQFATLETYSFEYKQNVTYHCDLGYWFGYQEFSRSVTCDKHGDWVPTPVYMVCWEIVCPPPSEQEHAVWEHIDKKTTLMSCEVGYEFSASRENSSTPDTIKLECGYDGEWVPDSSDFLCVEVQCEFPAPVPNTDNDIIPDLDVYEFSMEITYHCHPGRHLRYIFSPYSVSYQRCLYQGSDDLFYASEEACDTTRMLQLHWWKYSGAEEPMKLVDASTERCVATTEAPTAASPQKSLTFETCNVTSTRNQFLCSKHSVSDLILYLVSEREFYLTIDSYDGLVHTTSNKHLGVEFIDYNDRRNIVELDLCRYQPPHFSQTTTCLKGGGWNPTPSLIDCQPVRCPYPLEIPNAKMESDYLDVGYAATAQYTCEPGYEYLKGRNSYISRCSDHETWIPDPLSLPCKEVECPHFELPPGVVVKRGNIRRNTFGTELIIGCPAGFFFAPGKLELKITCESDMGWEGLRFNSCEPVDCKDPPKISNATVTTTGFNLFNTLARYVCDVGFWMERHIKWRDSYCVESGEWTPDPTTFNCQIVQCMEPGKVSDSIRHEVPRPRHEFTFGSVVMYKCEQGRWFDRGLYKVATTCRDDGRWYPHPSTLYCRWVKCDRPDPLPFNSFIVGQDYSYKSKLIVTCNPGYRMGGHDKSLGNSTEIECYHRNEWQPHPLQLVCMRVSCGEPPFAANAYMIASDNLFESYAQYVCNEGYWINIGLTTQLAKCNQHGEWKPDPSQFSCKAIDCGHPGRFPNALAVLPGNGTEFGNKAVMKCREGFWVEKLFKTETLVTCTRQGLWETMTENLRCIGVKCSSPPDLPRATRTLLPPAVFDDVVSQDPITGKLLYEYAVRVKYVCDNNTAFARRQQTIVAVCMGSGKWSVDWRHLNCSVTTCRSPRAIMHGYLSKNDATSTSAYEVNSTVEYTCDSGYWFEKDVYTRLATCQTSGLWDMDVTTLTCIRVTCGPPLPLDNAYFLSSGHSYPHTTRYSCYTGYRMTSESVAVCSGVGEWDPPVTEMSCELLFCPDEVFIENALILSAPASTAYGTIVDFECTPSHFVAEQVNRFFIECGAQGLWIGEDTRCLNIDQFECRMPPFVANAYYVTKTSRRATLRCVRGFEIRRSSGEVVYEEDFFCREDGSWQPTPPAACQEGSCSPPSIRGDHFMMVLNANSSKYVVGTVINIRCLGGSVRVAPTSGPIKYKRWVNITCGDTHEWVPDPASFQCDVVDCGTPPNISNTTLTYLTTTLHASARYLCTRLTSFGDRAIRHLTCDKDGLWKPDDWPDWRCVVMRCLLPAPPPMSVISSEGYDYLSEAGAIESYQFLRVTCQVGYRVKGTSNIFSSQFRCNREGEWWPRNPGKVQCEPVACGPIPSLDLTPLPVGGIPAAIISPYPYGFTLTYTCPVVQWFAPENVTEQTIRCRWNGTWEPAPQFRCIDVTCDYAPTVDYSSLRGSGLHVGATWQYTCDYGYRIRPGAFSQEATCETTGKWRPDPYKLKCEVIACPVPPLLPEVVNNGSLREMSPEQAYFAFREGSVYTYSCVPGYWMSDGLYKQTSGNVTCRSGDWLPLPQSAIRCIIVVCDTVVEVPGARSDGIYHVYGSFVTYSCARGQHFFIQKKRRLNVTCAADGRWWPDPHSLFCSDVKCDDFLLENSTRVRFSVGMGGTAIFKCASTTWFSPNVSQLVSRCNDNGEWEPDIRGEKCWTVDCGPPPLRNVLLPSDRFTYKTQMTLECIGGFYLVPDRIDPPIITCDITGFWYPDPREYRCEGIECVLPKHLRHATLTGNATFNSTVTVKCEPGYFMRRGMSVANATCLQDNTWTVDVNSMFCVPFKCLNPRQIALSTQSQATEVPVPIYNSMVEYHCDRGFWVADQEYSRVVRCGEEGLWDPPINFSCVAIRCKYPPVKRFSIITLEGGENATDFALGHALRYSCLNASWLSAQHVITEWAFTGLLEVKIVCKETGRFSPHPDSFACRAVDEGPLPVGYERGLTDQQVEYQPWLEEDPFLTPELMEHPYLVAVPAGPTSWIDGSTLPNMLIKGDNKPEEGHEATKAWDGSLLTDWKPHVTETRQYSATIFLGGLYQIEGFQAYSGRSSNSPDRIQNLVLRFSPHGKWFNSSVATAEERSASAGRAIVTQEASALSSKITITDFTHVAKFMQIVITDTDNAAYPPSVREMALLASPAEWRVVYPADFFTLPGFLLFVLVCFVSAAIYAQKQDALDREKVQFGWRPSDLEILTNEDCYLINLTIKEPERIKHFLCRVVGDTSCTASVLVDSPLKSERLMLVLPSYCDNPVCFDVGLVESGRTVDLPPIFMDVKIGLLHSGEVFHGRLPWKCVMRNVGIISNEPVRLHLDSGYQLRRRTTLRKLANLDPIYWSFYWLLTDHLLYTVFCKDFISQTSRLDRLLCLTVGLMVSLCASFLLFDLDLLHPVYELLSCYGAGALSSLVALPMVVCVMELMTRDPVFCKTNVRPDVEHQMWDWETEEDTDKKKRKKSIVESEKDLPKFDMDPRLEFVAKKFARLCFEGLDEKGPFARVVYSATDTADSCLLPGEYRHSLPDISDSEASTVCTVDMQKAYDKRKKRRRRRTRSAPAILQYKGRKKWAPGKVASYASLTDLRDKDDDDRLSCASMWSNESIVNQWHQVHTSIREPIDYLFSKCMPEESVSIFSWHDPNYRRIPTTIHEPGFRACVPIRHPDWLRRELERRALIRPKQQYVEDGIPITFAGVEGQEASSTGTQFPVAYVLRGARRMGGAARRLLGTLTPNRDTLSNLLPGGEMYRNVMPEMFGGRPGPRWIHRKVPALGELQLFRRPDDRTFADPPHTSSVAMETMPGDDVVDDVSGPGPSASPEMVLRNRARRRALPTSPTMASTDRCDPECLAPSAGGMFSSNQYDSSSSVYSDTSSAARRSTMYSAQQPKIFKSKSEIKKEKRKPPILITSPANFFYQISASRVLLAITLCACALGCVGVVVLLGMSSVDRSGEVACLYFVATASYFIVTLSIEAVLRHKFQMKRERLSLSVLRHIKQEELEKEEDGEGDATSLKEKPPRH